MGANDGRRLYLGVDAGGTKTALALIDSEGTIRGMHVAPGTNYLSLGLDSLGSLLASAVAETLNKSELKIGDVDFAFFGLSGHGEDSTLVDALDRLPGQYMSDRKFLCGNDMICGWAGSFACRDGINVVSGTGSICYGERHGLTARSGGWGEIFSDEGSGYWIAVRGLNLFAHMSDGRTPVGPLYALVRQQLQIAHDLDLCAHVYTRLQGDRARVAQLCGIVLKASAADDEQATMILSQAANELALMVDAIRQRLGFEAPETIPVSCSGGVFEDAGGLLLHHFRAALRAREARYQLCEPAFSPALGAALYAAKYYGRPLSDAALERLREQTSPARLGIRASDLAESIPPS
jgi:N-acetylglucosamine kinase-like BadF-type ATPase